MITKKFETELLITPLAAAGVLQEIIPQEIDTETLKEIIKFAGHLTIGWDKVWALAKRQLEIIEVAERMVKERDQKT
jgi:hypothetical protein